MLDRDQSLDLIKGVYAARVKGDKDALGRYWAPDAHFEIVGDRGLLGGVPLTAPRPMEAISQLIDRFQFSDLELLDSVVEGSTMAVRWQVTILTAGKAPVVTQLFDLIKLDDQGRISSLLQFVDTALIRHLSSV